MNKGANVRERQKNETQRREGHSSVEAATALRILTALSKDTRFKSIAFTLQAELVVVIKLQHDSKILQINPGT